MPRNSKLSPERQALILGLVRKGLSPEKAARAAGVSPTTYYRWMQQGANPGHPDPQNYTLPQLRAIAAAQDVDLEPLGPRPTRAQVAGLVEAPTPFREFRESIKRAEAEGEGYALERCIQAGGTMWQMWAWILERRFGWVRPEPVQEAQPTRGSVDPVAALELGRLRLKVLAGEAPSDGPPLPPVRKA